ncbi:MAG: flagellar biosynthesis anti-sigma factor FlgM [Pseudomonadales bacterium]|jgi:negative regulator of flagellin synthesis FlgM
MVNEINSFTQGSVSNAGKKTERVDAVRAENQQHASASAEPVGESIEISSQAQLLSKLEAQIKELPDVDQSRVDAIRERINQGSYEIDNFSLAQSIINFEF